MKKTMTEECKEMVLQAMEAVQNKDEEKFSQLLYPIPEEEWKQETGEQEPPTAEQLQRALCEIKNYGFSLPYKIESLYTTEEYYERNWYETRQIPVICAADAAVYWATAEKRTICCAWPISFQCLYIEDTWYLNPYWVWEYLKP